MNNKRLSKIVISFLIVTALISCLTSCGKEATNKVDNNEIISQKDINLSADDSSGDKSQSYFSGGNHYVAKGEGGYYFLSSNSRNIMYFDKESLTSFPLCGKADCKHDNVDCNSYIEPLTHVLGTIYYYKGYIYMLKISQGNAVLEKINADGSARQELGIICPTDGDGGSVGLVFHGESIYVFDKGHEAYSDTEYTEVIRKFSLDGKSEGNIFEYTGTNIAISTGESYGNILFFEIKQVTKDTNDKLTGSSLGLFAYDYTTQETDQVMSSNIRSFSIDEKNSIIYYFIDGEGLYKYNITTKENVKIFEADEETGSCLISYDGRYIYMNNLGWCITQKSTLKKKLTQKCWVIDSDGSIINTINCDGILVFYFGDDAFLFAEKANNSSPADLAYINKKDIENAKDWTSLGSTTQ